MKTSHIFWGVFFLTIGGLLLLGNFTELNFTWDSAWKYWPMVLVLIGVSILVKNQVGKNIIGGLAGLVLAFTLYASVSATTNLLHNNIDFSFDDDNGAVYDTTNYIEDFSDSIKTASINFSGGAGTFNIITPTDKLAEFRALGKEENYKVSRNDNGSHSEITFDMKSSTFRFGKKNYKNKVDMSLSQKPDWELNFEVGAASLDLDLTPYKVSRVDVDMGAAALKIKFGDLAESTRFKLNAGASDIDILIPDSTGCEINSDVALSSKNYEGFKKVSKQIYHTENFDTAKKRIYIEIDSGVSSIDVRKY